MAWLVPCKKIVMARQRRWGRRGSYSLVQLSCHGLSLSHYYGDGVRQRCLGRLRFLGTRHTVPVWVHIFDLVMSGHCPKFCGIEPERLADVPGSQAEQVKPWLWLEH